MWTRRTLLALTILSCLGCTSEEEERKEILEVVQQWARVAPPPETAEMIRIEALGGSLSREFVVEFTAPESDVLAWFGKSPGLPSNASLGERDLVVKVEPGGGAQFAEVKWELRSSRVIIRTYWS